MEAGTSSLEGLEIMSAIFWKEKRVLVTGATGIVGSCLVKDLLARGAKVVALVFDADPQSELYRSKDIDKITVVNGKLEDYWTLERAINANCIDTVFHLGAQTIVGTAQRSPLGTFESNIRGTYNLLEVCRVHNNLVKQIVIASSDKAYGEHSELPYKEDMQLKGRYPYEVSKTCVDLLAQSYYHTYQLPVVIVRCGNIYGEGDLNWNRIVPGTIRSFLKGERPIIRSDGTFIRDYIYVKDISQAYIYLAESLEDKQLAGEAFNFSRQEPMTVLELVKVIQGLMGCESINPQILNCAEGEILTQHLCAAKAREKIGWESQFSLEEGLTKTIEWYGKFFAGKQ